MRARWVAVLCLGCIGATWALCTAATMRLWVSIPMAARGAKL